MKKLGELLGLHTLRLQTVTPAFVGGASPGAVDIYNPLRGSSVRGMLRWWFRAAVAAQLWPKDESESAKQQMLDDLKQMEAAVFGDTERASAFAILPTNQLITKTDVPPDRRRSRGLRYLGYGIFEAARTSFIEQDQTIELPLRLRGRRGDEVAEILAATIWLWTHLGGIGARSNRGWGSLQLTDLGDLPWSGPLKTPQDQADLPRYLNEGLEHVQQAVKRFLDVFSHQRYVGAGPHPQIRTLVGITALRTLPCTWETSQAALEETGRLFQDYRSTIARERRGEAPLSDYHEVKAAINGQVGAPRHISRAAFGLPLPFYFRSLDGAKATAYPSEFDRLASPLRIRVHPTKKGVSVLLLHLAESKLSDLMLGQKLALKIHSPRRTVQAQSNPDPRTVTHFIHWAQQQINQKRGHR